ncbi:SRPBCC family protein [Devosia nitrariae]|uniref:Activator of HSP90 ATPase n=1 Tax=Devosia nitrariae TaxID=2071872 RepID=A0ABQ5W5J7_9HYPH|nr:SRPBCC family protein [Devosia nitrariae]GLQ55355.1 activator of HSP90 ATPase [Devosia nitrariae]
MAGESRGVSSGQMKRNTSIANMMLTHAPIAKTDMLIRKPAEDVFEAIVDPAITSNFWFSKGSGRLETGAQVQWVWESHDVVNNVVAIAVERNRHVLIEWPGYAGLTQVEWTFEAIPDGTTFVRVTEAGWEDDADKLVRYVADSTQGFTLLLAGMKAFLEHGIRLNLTLDRYPEGIEEQVIGE